MLLCSSQWTELLQIPGRDRAVLLHASVRVCKCRMCAWALEFTAYMSVRVLLLTQNS